MRSISSKDKGGSLLLLFALVLLASPATSSTKQYRTLTFPNGTTFRAEVADTLEARTRGLMFREHLPENEGMLFVFEKADAHQFWMKNCKISLDILWLDQHGKIIYSVENAPPCKKDPCPLYGPTKQKARYVIEMRGGGAKKNRLQQGRSVQFLSGENL